MDGSIGATASPRRRASLFHDMWRSYARTALVPLVMVELLLIVAYFTTNALTRDANIAAVRASAERSMAESVRLNAALTAERLDAVAGLTEVLRRQVRAVMLAPPAADPAEVARFRFDSEDVVYYTPEDTGVAAGFYSGVVPVTPAMQEKAARLAAIDPILRDVQQSSPLIVQAYLNTWDSYNRIFPFFDPLEVYAPRLDIPSFNFYYEADARHNPDGGIVWTDAYVDPAGQGWLISAVAPVLRPDGFLEGVVGVDVTLDTVVQRVLDVTTPWGGFAVLVERNGTILAMPPEAERALGLEEVGAHSYAQAVKSNTFKPEAYALERVADLAHLPIVASASGAGEADLAGARHLVAWNDVPGADWHLAVFVPEAALFADAAAVGDRFDRVGLMLVAVLVVFYAVFFAALYAVVRRNAARLALPLEALASAADGIAQGDFRQRVPDSDIAEIAALGESVVEMGRQLGEKTENLVATTRSLEESDAFRRCLIENLPVPVVFFGATFETVVARNTAYDALIAAHGPAALQAALGPVLRQGARAVDLVLDLGDPPHRFTGHATRLPHGSGAPAGTLCVLVDVTVQEEARRRVAEARDRALEAARLKSEFLAKVTHELRTPLNGIIGLAELAEDETDSGRIRADVRAIGRSARSLLAIVEDLLDLSAIETGRVTMEPSWFTPRALVEDVLAGFRLQAREKGLTVSADASGSAAGPVHGPAGRIRQVLTSLVNNAVKFTDSGGVRVGAGLRHQGGRALLEVAVEDTGVGLGRDAADIFDPFRQGDNGLDRRFQGMGLGLAIARDLAIRMGGGLVAERRAGRGMRFTLTVPVVASEHPAPATPAAARASCLLLGGSGAQAELVRGVMVSRDAEAMPVPAVADALAVLRAGRASAVVAFVRGAADLAAVRDILAVRRGVRVGVVLGEDAPRAVHAVLERMEVPIVAQPVTASAVVRVLDRLIAAPVG